MNAELTGAGLKSKMTRPRKAHAAGAGASPIRSFFADAGTVSRRSVSRGGAGGGAGRRPRGSAHVGGQERTARQSPEHPARDVADDGERGPLVRRADKDGMAEETSGAVPRPGGAAGPGAPRNIGRQSTPLNNAEVSKSGEPSERGGLRATEAWKNAQELQGSTGGRGAQGDPLPVTGRKEGEGSQQSGIKRGLLPGSGGEGEEVELDTGERSPILFKERPPQKKNVEQPIPPGGQATSICHPKAPSKTNNGKQLEHKGALEEADIEEDFPPLPSPWKMGNAQTKRQHAWPSPENFESGLGGSSSQALSWPELDAALEKKFTKFTQRMEEVVRNEVNAVQSSLEKVASKVNRLENGYSEFKKEIRDNKDRSSQLEKQVLDLALRVEDQENRGRRCNVRLRGLPEDIGPNDLEEVAVAIFKDILGGSRPEPVKIDRIHRVAGPPNPNRPRDVLCCLHHFQTKENILRKAWEKGAISFRGGKVLVLQDLASKTLRMRRALKPLLECIHQKGGTYRWGFPFHVVIRKGGDFFVLKAPSQVPEACSFLGVQPIQVPDWQDILLEPNPAFYSSKYRGYRDRY